MWLSKELESVRGLAREFARGEILPKAAEFDRSEQFPHQIFRGSAENWIGSGQYPG